MRRLRLCVVSACYDEQEMVRPFYEALRAVLGGLGDCDAQILLVDDGSRDDTLAILNGIADADERVLVYSLSRNFGHQAALSAGLAVADADVVVMMDSDLQHPPELIPRMLEEWRKGADVVSAVRCATAAPVAKRAGSLAFYRLINLLSDTPIPESVADFCLLSRRAQRALLAMPERHRFLRGLVAWMGFERVLVPYEAPPRPAGEPKYGLRQMVGLATDAVFSFSTRPVRIASRIGLAVTAVGAVYLAYILVRAMVLGDLVRGWGSLVSVVLILGGLQLLFVGIIGEYVARVFEEVKGRPLYFFKQTPESRRAGRTPEGGA